MLTSLLLFIILGCVVVFAAIQDLRYQKIPNLLTYPVMIIALCYYSVMNGSAGLVFSAAGLIIGIAVFVIPYLMGGIGAGDAKLMGAVGAVIGAKGVFIAFLITGIVGGVYALGLMLVNRQYSKGFIARHATTVRTFLCTGQFVPIPGNEEKKNPKLRYAVAIGLGTFIYMFLNLSGRMWLN